MQQRHGQTSESNLDDLLGTYLHVSARYAPPSYSLRSVASAFNAWPTSQASKVQPTNQTADTLQPCSDVPVSAELAKSKSRTTSAPA